MNLSELSAEEHNAVILAHIHNRLADLVAAVQLASRNTCWSPRHINVNLENLTFDFSEVQNDDNDDERRV